MQRCKSYLCSGLLIVVTLLVLSLAVWGPEYFARYKDQEVLNTISTEAVPSGREGYRYTMSNNEKLYILSKCLDNQILPESELSAKTRMRTGGIEYEELTGSYAFVVNYQGPSDKEITDEQIYEIVNREIALLQEKGVLPETVKEINASSYNAELFSAIDVLEPRNNLSVWKVGLSTSQQNADKSNRLLDAYIDADTGKIYEFYVRTELEWGEVDSDALIRKWAEYMELEGLTEYEDKNPLLENTPYFKKYRFVGAEEQSTVVTVGFYEGIRELYLKITK